MSKGATDLPLIFLRPDFLPRHVLVAFQRRGVPTLVLRRSVQRVGGSPFGLSTGLPQEPTAADVDQRAVDESRRVTDQKQDGGSHFLGRAVMRQGRGSG